jgi:phosphatidylglycerophosphate synthase
MESVKELKIKCQEQKMTGKDFNLMIGYLAHRKISIYLTKFLLTVWPPIRPDFVSWMMILIGVGGSILLSFFNFYAAVLGVFLVYLSFLLDKVDGEIARYKQLFSLRGIYLDEIYHAIVPAAVIFFFLYRDAALWPRSGFLTLAVFLSLLNRYNRKMTLIVYAKNENGLRAGKFQPNLTESPARKIFNFPLLKISSIVERFDIVIAFVFLAIAVEKFSFIPLRSHFLYGYCVVNLLYFIRQLALNYFGGVERSVKEIAEKGY